VLLEDFILREKITHFDHERIVHARATGVHGYFELTSSLKKYSTARILTEVGEETPVFTRLSTVAGGAGSVDTPRDVRGFAVKFYTKEGNWDLVGNDTYTEEGASCADFVQPAVRSSSTATKIASFASVIPTMMFSY
jgi:catalase